MNITHKWQRMIAVGCSHGEHLCPRARKAVLRMIDTWKPELRFHVGDFCDLTAFRSGARGTADESKPLPPDIDAGLSFLEEMRATHVALGNHEDRVYRLLDDRRELVRYAAQRTVDKFDETFKRLKAQHIKWSAEHWFEFGGFRIGHGTLWNEQYLRDSAETFGNCIVAHGHKAGMARARRLDSARCFGVGCLCEPFSHDYAKARRATLAWSGGFVWGEVSKAGAALWLHENEHGGNEEWRLPVC